MPQLPPSILPLEIFQIGQLVVPGEFTTMAGCEAVKEVMTSKDRDSNVHVVTNTYEEYQIQRYEGASTLYGPHSRTMNQLKHLTYSRSKTAF
ncbi:hypothetical protein QVD17_42209 [Tagetes erecta]|uniref:Neutral/alkaline non-lysosomal ceramidase N-terminal domain-containing protein n=1 Tax=Tagetes erecta TaxID=13708 RepID=A0AAD8NE48_TARER|nr:hypothetical protein QVD17_42209 [Tagetes erecta]